MCYRSKSRAIYDNPKNSSCFTTFHPYCLRFSCDAIMQPASIGCNSRVWVFPTSILQSKIRVCGAQCSNESPSGAFKRQNGLRQQMEGPCPNKFADVYTSALLATTMNPLNALPRFENHFAIETVRFQVQLEAGGYFSDLFLLPFQSAFIPFAPCPHGIQNRFQAIGHKSSSDAVFFASDELFSVAFSFKPPWSFADTPMLPIQRAERS